MTIARVDVTVEEAVRTLRVRVEVDVHDQFGLLQRDDRQRQ